MSTIESQIADAVLERKKEITIGRKKYKIVPPLVATLILVSETISRLPIMRWTTKEREIVPEVLRKAKDMRLLGDLAAILILGPAKGFVQEIIWKFRIRSLSKKVLVNTSPSELQNLIFQQLESLEIGAFFGLTTSLSEANILKPKKEVVKTTTSGQ